MPARSSTDTVNPTETSLDQTKLNIEHVIHMGLSGDTQTNIEKLCERFGNCSRFIRNGYFRKCQKPAEVRPYERIELFIDRTADTDEAIKLVLAILI